jgi:hypothetical protein
MTDTIRELKVDEVENVVGGGGSNSATGSDSIDSVLTSKTLKSIVWGNGHK